MLQDFNFPPKLTKVIMSCVTSSSISILVNGGALESFEPSRDIRQRDPLSSYLFILCMEYLKHLIKQKCVDGVWIPLKASRENLGFSHLQFGQKINAKKTRLYFSPNFNENLKEEVCERLDIRETQNIGKYLGFPLRHKGINRNPYKFIVERVMSKLSGWKMKFLSFVRRAVLIKSVMSTIPNYVMQGIALPAHVCDKLDKIN